jgi:hypothetical protein
MVVPREPLVNPFDGFALVVAIVDDLKFKASQALP